MPSGNSRLDRAGELSVGKYSSECADRAGDLVGSSPRTERPGGLRLIAFVDVAGEFRGSLKHAPAA